jgi:hypothetical protein
MVSPKRQDPTPKRQKSKKVGTKKSGKSSKTKKKPTDKVKAGPARRRQREIQAQRYELVRELLLTGMSNARIVARVMREFGVAQKTAYHDLNQALKEAYEQAEKVPGLLSNRAAFTERLQDMIYRAVDEGKYAPAMNGMRIFAKMHGWEEASRVDVSLPPGVVEAVKAAQTLTPAQRAVRIAALEARDAGE